MNITELIKLMPSNMNAAAAANLSTTIQYRITQPMYLVIDNGQCAAHEGTADTPNLTIIISDDNLVLMLTGELNGISAFMSGKLKVEGDMMLAQRLPAIFDTAKLSKAYHG
jgi:putative sterol carrier protein